MKKTDKQFWMGMYNLATVGLNMVAATFIGLGMGWFIDNKLWGILGLTWQTTPWFTMAFLIMGIIAGFLNIFRIIRAKGGMDDDGDE